MQTPPPLRNLEVRFAGTRLVAAAPSTAWVGDDSAYRDNFHSRIVCFTRKCGITPTLGSQAGVI